MRSTQAMYGCVTQRRGLTWALPGRHLSRLTLRSRRYAAAIRRRLLLLLLLFICCLEASVLVCDVKGPWEGHLHWWCQAVVGAGVALQERALGRSPQELLRDPAGRQLTALTVVLRI